MKKCSVDGCDNYGRIFGLCDKHDKRLKKYGSVDGGPANHAPAEERLWRKVDKTSDCWIWRGNTTPAGYGRIQSGGKGSPTISTHRLAWELHHKRPAPDGMVVMHSCDNPKCCNPAHLRLGTHKENTADMIAKGRHARQAPRGTAHGKAVLDPDKVRLIRARTDLSNHALARMLGVGVNTVRYVRIGKNWSHVT